jgi:ATP-dependent protease ClpP protease subunit
MQFMMNPNDNTDGTSDTHDRDDAGDTQLTYHPRRRASTSAVVGTKRRRCDGGDSDDVTQTRETQTDDDDAAAKGTKPHLSESDVSSRCFARGNHIYFFSGVSKDSVYRLQDCLCKLNDKYRATQQANPSMVVTPKPIYLHINSYGGGVFAALAAIDFIEQSEIPVHTIIEGASASAATLMSVVGKKRYIRPHASMLVHQLSSWFGGKLTEIEDDYQNVAQMHRTIKAVYKKHTTLRDTDLDDILKHDLWWNADKCLQEGLVDELWTGKDE